LTQQGLAFFGISQFFGSHCSKIDQKFALGHVAKTVKNRPNNLANWQKNANSRINII